MTVWGICLFDGSPAAQCPSSDVPHISDVIYRFVVAGFRSARGDMMARGQDSTR